IGVPQLLLALITCSLKSLFIEWRRGKPATVKQGFPKASRWRRMSISWLLLKGERLAGGARPPTPPNTVPPALPIGGGALWPLDGCAKVPNDRHANKTCTITPSWLLRRSRHIRS